MSPLLVVDIRFQMCMIFLLGASLALAGCFSDGPPAVQETDLPEKDEREENEPSEESDDRPVNFCGEPFAPAVPVTSKMGNEENWFQFYQFQGASGTGSVYISWHLETEFFVPEGWAFGAQIWDNQNEVQGTFLLEEQSGSCQYISESSLNFWYFVEAGPWQWAEESACTVTMHWGDEVGARLEFSLESSNATLGPYQWTGGPYEDSCPTDDAKFNRQSIFAGEGRAEICVSCLLPEV